MNLITKVASLDYIIVLSNVHSTVVEHNRYTQIKINIITFALLSK